MKKKRRIALMLSGAMAFSLCLVACGNGEAGVTYETKESTGAVAEFTGEKYVYNGSDAIIKTEDIPENYVCVPYDQFESGFKSIIMGGDVPAGSTYAEVAKAFGDDGIKMNVDGISYDGYVVYKWLSDKDWVSSKVDVMVTFEVKDGDLIYYAYASNGITPDDVK